MRMVNKPLTFALLVGTRGFFNAQLAREGRTDILKRLAELGYGSVILPEDATASGAVESYADAMKCAELFKKRREDIDGVLVVLPNFGDEVGVASALNLAKLDVPVLVIACDDEVDKVDLNHRRDAFCGKISVCNNLYQYGIPFTDTRYHTYSLTGQELADDLRSFAAVCRTVRGLRSARIGAIGARPAAFQTMRASEKLLQATGITVVPLDLSEIISAAQKMGNSPEVALRLKEIGEYGRIPSTIVRENITKQAKLALAIEAWMEKNQLDAAAVQCWS
jgi:L-fucose isomerase-like protein